MITSSLATQTVNTRVHLDLGGDEAVIEMGDNPHYSMPVQVSGLAIAYEATISSDSTAASCKVTDITYTVIGQDYSTVGVHPDYLDKPEALPAWAQTLVDQYRPTPPQRKSDNCPQCAAPATVGGDRIPKHREGCPANF